MVKGGYNFAIYKNWYDKNGNEHPKFVRAANTLEQAEDYCEKNPGSYIVQLKKNLMFQRNLK